jgi:hypothetical protein
MNKILCKDKVMMKKFSLDKLKLKFDGKAEQIFIDDYFNRASLS